MHELSTRHRFPREQNVEHILPDEMKNADTPRSNVSEHLRIPQDLVVHQLEANCNDYRRGS